MPKAKIQFIPHEGQLKAWNSNARIVAMIAGSGGGKSKFGSFWLLREIQRYPGASFLVVAPSFSMLTRNVMPYMQEILIPLGAYYRTNEKVWYLPDGGRVIMGSADNPLSLEGAHVRAAWLDEAGQMDSLTWDVVRRRTAFYSGRILITTTPYSFNWLKTEIYDKWASGADPNIDVIQFDSRTNPYFSTEEYNYLKATLPEWKFKMFYEAQWARPSGLVYADFDTIKNVVEPFDIPLGWRRFIGVDWGFNNPSAAMWIAVDPDDGTYYAYREYKKKGLAASELAPELSRMSIDEPIWKIYVDPSAADLKKELRRYFPAAVSDNTDNNVMNGIGSVIVAFKKGKLKIFNNMTETFKELQSYRWKTNNDLILDEPVKEDDHLMDAMRYVVHSTMKRNAGHKIPVPKPQGW